MKSYHGGCGIGDTQLHMIHYFDGFRVREIELSTLHGVIHWTEKTVPGIIETGISYRTAKRRLAAYEKKCTQRIG